MKNALIYNPFASKGASRYKARELLEALKGIGIKVDLLATAGDKHVTQLAEQAALEGAERVIVCGGDGTINEAVNGLVAAQKQGVKDTALAFIPNGRGNDFLSAVGINRDLDSVMKVIAADHRVRADIGAAGDGTFERYFMNGSGFGIDSAVNYYAGESILNGKLSYAYGVIMSVAKDLSQQIATITLDDKTFDFEIVLFTAMNGRQEGGGFRLAPNFSLTDGKLDICYIGGGLPAWRLLKTIPRLSAGLLDHPDIHTAQAASVHVHLEPDKKGLISQVDGETIILHGHDFYAKVAPYKIDLVLPEKNSQ